MEILQYPRGDTNVSSRGYYKNKADKNRNDRFQKELAHAKKTKGIKETLVSPNQKQMGGLNLKEGAYKRI